ncbi:hypothetical protein KKD61_03075 [Patescibacteria group bacterium]|nr:hypothetical protein [Patescibacteria group bacterium]
MAKKGIGSSCKRIFKIASLIGLRESWLLFKNSLGLVYHPFLTLRQIRKKRDFSQTFLVISLIVSPLTISLFLTLILFISSRLFHFYLPYEREALLFLVIFSSLFVLSSILYLAYWSLKVIKKNHFNFY